MVGREKGFTVAPVKTPSMLGFVAILGLFLALAILRNRIQRDGLNGDIRGQGWTHCGSNTPGTSK